jgi:hypothetical protein
MAALSNDGQLEGLSYGNNWSGLRPGAANSLGNTPAESSTQLGWKQPIQLTQAPDDSF